LAEDVQDVPGGGDAGLLLGGLFARDKQRIVGESIGDATRRDGGSFRGKRRAGQQPAISAKSHDPRRDAAASNADAEAFTGRETTTCGGECRNSALRGRAPCRHGIKNNRGAAGMEGELSRTTRRGRDWRKRERERIDTDRSLRRRRRRRRRQVRTMFLFFFLYFILFFPPYELARAPILALRGLNNAATSNLLAA